MTIPALVILDLAGTTVEDHGQVPAAFASALSANGITVTDDDIARVRGASKRQAIRNLLPRLREDASVRQATDSDAEVERIYAEFRRLLTETYSDGGVREVPGAGDVIRDLRGRGIKVALTTGFDRVIAALVLTSLGWTRNVFDAIVCGDEVPHGRPAPDLILVAMKLTMVEDPARVAHVGDTVLDLQSAARAGLKWNIGVLSGAHNRAELEGAPHTHIIQSVAGLGGVF